MDEEERICKTCHCFNIDAYYCRCVDASMAEWDTCDDHETYEELDARLAQGRGDKMLVSNYDQEANVMYLSFYWPAKKADDTKKVGDALLRYKGEELIGVTILNWRESTQEATRK